MNEKRMTFAVYTLGCRVNQYESEAISEELTSFGLTACDFSEKCDIYIINTCAVTEESVRKSRQIVRRAKKSNPEAFVAVCGCASQLQPQEIADSTGADFVCGTRNKKKLVSSVLDFAAGKREKNVIREAPDGEFEDFRISEFRRARAYLKIQDGCNGHCAYCVICKVRGGSVSRKEEDILAEVRRLAEGGVGEVVFTGIETSAYGPGLPGLIRKASEIEGIERIRLGSLDPSVISRNFAEELLSVGKFMPHLHLSLQSGSDRILALMRRKYNSEKVRQSVEILRSIRPGINFSADVIVGFPTETEDDFVQSCALLRDIDLLHGHIFTYSPRPGTEAAEMDGQIPENVKNDRSARLIAQCEAQKKAILERKIAAGAPVELLIEEEKNGMVLGHTPDFCEAAFPCGGSTSCRRNLCTISPERVEDGILIGNLL